MIRMHKKRLGKKLYHGQVSGKVVDRDESA